MHDRILLHTNCLAYCKYAVCLAGMLLASSISAASDWSTASPMTPHGVMTAGTQGHSIPSWQHAHRPTSICSDCTLKKASSVLCRDLKPENVLLTTSGGLKLSDFGLGHLPSSSLHNDVLQTTCGTPNYVAPEVLMRQGYYGAPADVWSLGQLTI